MRQTFIQYSSTIMDRETWPRAILHLDMDAFFVNVHLLDNPQDAQLPLVVGGRPEQRGVVASASYEARELGIHSAMPTSRALRLCRDLIIVPAEWSRIRECSHQVMAELAQFGPLEKMSVDEAYVDLTEHAQPVEVSDQIRSAVREATGLPCSVGLATSKLVAKVASDHDKPEGFTVVRPGAEREFLAPLSTRVILGVGPRTAERLSQLGIDTCGKLAEADEATLRASIGRQAAELIRRAQGIDDRHVTVDRGQAKSISQEWTFSKDISNGPVLENQLREMSNKVARSLQKRGLLAHTITVKIRLADFTTFTRQKSLSVGIDREDDLFRLAENIWRENWTPGQPIRLLGVGASSLVGGDVRQLSFDFGTDEQPT